MKNLLLGALLLFLALKASSQDLPRVTTKIFINDIFINPSPSVSPYMGDILVEDGIITKVGPNLTLPYDAEVIEGDSMHVYSGFIATLSHIGLKEPKENGERPKVARTGYPPNDVAGITPEKSIAELYDHKNGAISSFRKEGFTIAHSVPFGKMLPGMGSIISLNGESFDDAVISQDHSMFAQWVSSRGVFPGTLIGIMSKWREMYRNAELSQKHVNAYKTNPVRRKRPSQDAATSALFPVISKEMPVFFIAEKHRDVYRTLNLKKDLGFNLVISEVKDVDRMLGDVKSSGAQILLSLDLPKEEKKKEEKKKEEGDKGKSNKDQESKNEDSKKEKPKKKESEPKKEDEKMAKLQKRKEESISRYIGQARTLSQNGLPVAFSYMETKPKDVHANIRRLVKDGFSEAQALSSLTTQAASTLGISNIAGTVENGKIGNLVITTKPLFDEKSKIKMVMVDGVIHKYDVKEKKKKTAGEEAIDVSGEWSYKIDIPGFTPTGSMIFTKSGDAYDLEVTNSQAPGEKVTAEGVEMDGSNMIFSLTMPAGGMNITMENDLTFDGETFEGTVSVGDFGSFEITGSKSTPE